MTWVDGSTDSGVPWGELELLREGLSAAGVGAWTWDIVRDQVLWSRNVASIFAVDPAEFGGSYEAYLELLDGPARALVTGEVGRCLSGEIDSYLLVHPLDRPGRERRYLECRGRIWRGVEGQPLRMAVTGVDVTEKRAARLSLEREQALRGAVIAAGAMGVGVCDLAGNVVLANPRAEVLLGSQSLTGRDLRGIFPSGELGAQLA